MLQLVPKSPDAAEVPESPRRTCTPACCRVTGVADRSTSEQTSRVRTAEFPTRAIEMGTLEGSPNPPATLRSQQSWLAPHAVDDAELARAGMLGQAWSHREIWYRFAPMVYSVLRRTLGARHDHEDLLQEVFLRVFRRLDTLQNPAALRSFVYSFAIRVLREELRRHRIRSKFAALFPGPAHEPSVPHVDFESRELLARIQAAMDGMPARPRAVFVLRRFDAMELAEIATNLDLSLSTVKRDLEQADEHIARSIHRDPRLRAGLEGEPCNATDARAREQGR
jgi:RNA polymerase sigma factor (sigma-70 family)